ncbi:hypothetical protein ACMXY6_09115 [Pasteurella multocida]|uniref:hypothetical protein n=1 Tax=Pasteurella multocida TaxID=747 RepID=UPI000943A2FA|nr:hypothetical protein [Pasteurella multocida]HDR1335172.1 hypothetical protein [Pasteurella multocida]
MNIEIIVKFDRDEVWSITYDKHKNVPIKGSSISSKEKLKQIKQSIDIARKQLQSQILSSE